MDRWRRVALYLQDAHPIRDGMRYAQAAEAAGFEAVWQAESRLVREATIPLAAFGAVTERIKLGSGVVSACGCATRRSSRRRSRRSTISRPGRVILGIGAWWDPLAAKVGVSRDRPLLAMREIVTVVRALLAGETVTFDGEFVHLDGVELDYVHQERRPKDVPIVIGATGMQMMRARGRDRRRRAAELSRVARVQRRCAGGARRGRGEGRSRRRRHRPPAARRVLDGRRPRRRARRGPPARDAVSRPAAAHHEGVGRSRRSCSTRSARCSRGPRPTSRWSRRRSSCPTRSCS